MKAITNANKAEIIEMIQTVSIVVTYSKQDQGIYFE